MIYIKRVFPSGKAVIYKGIHGEWYHAPTKGGFNWWSAPEDAYPTIVGHLDRAAKHGSSTETSGPTNQRPTKKRLSTYYRTTEEEAAMILFQRG